MRTVSEHVLIAIPATLAVGLVGLFATPLQLGEWSLTPNVAWVMSLVVASLYPAAWPRGFAFALGLLQDVLFGTPLGAQALLTLLLVLLVHMQARRQHYLLFRIRWLEAAGTLLAWNLLLWAVLNFVSPHTPSLGAVLINGVVSALWYPLFFLPLRKLCDVLPAAK